MLLNNNLVIFSTSRAIREFFNSQKHQDTLLPKSFTIGEFFDNCVLTKNKLATDDIRLFYLKQAIKASHYAKLGIVDSYNSFLKQSDYLIRFFEELAHENVKIDSIQTKDTYAMYEDHLSILSEILDEYQKLLGENGFIDKISLVNDYELNTTFLNSFHKITLHLDGYLSHFEFELIRQCSEYVPVVIVLKSTKNNQKNCMKFMQLGFDLKIGFEYELCLPSMTIQNSKPLIQKETSLVVSNFQARYEQCNFVHYAIYEMMQKGITSDKICVVLPDESFAQDLLLYDGLKHLNFAMGISLKQSYFFQKIVALFEALNELEPKTQKKLAYFGVEADFFHQLQNKRFEPITKEIIEKLQAFVCDGLTEQIKQKIDREFYFLQKLYHLGFAFKTQEFIKTLIEKISLLSMDYVGGGEVTVLGILETRGAGFDGVIVVDFNEKQLPKMSVKDKYLSTNLKKLANLPTIHDRKNLQKYFYEQLFFNAKEVYISYVQNEQEGISPFALELFGSAKINSSYVALNFASVGTVLCERQIDPITKEIDLSKLSWSAYKLKDFLECKRRFYYKHIEKLAEINHDLYRNQKKDIGSIVHKVLHHLMSKMTLASDVQSLQKELLKQIGQMKKQNVSMIFELSIWEQKLLDFIAYEKQRLEGGIFIEALEHKFKTKILDVEFSGIIDRVDRLDDGYMIIDYKTGSNIKISDPNDFQLEIYAFGFGQKSTRGSLYDLSNTKLIEKKSLEEGMQELQNIVATLKTTHVDFVLSDEPKHCKFCPYVIMCGRE